MNPPCHGHVGGVLVQQASMALSSHLRWMLQPFRGSRTLCYPSHLSWKSFISDSPAISQRLFSTKSFLISRKFSKLEQFKLADGDRNLVVFSKEAEEDSWSFAVIPGFISPEEEESLMMDVSRSLRGKKYQFNHWDGVCE